MVLPWRLDEKKMDVVPSVSMSTILIVRPRKSFCRKAAMVTMKVPRNFICCQGRAGQAPRRRIATGNTLSH